MAELNENVELQEETVEVENTATEETKMSFADRTAAKRQTIKNPFVRVLYMLVTYIAVVFLDFIDSFKRNPIKIGAMLIAIPGIFIGFFMNYEIESLYGATDAKLAPICIFILVLCGMVNIFEAFTISKLRNFSSILIATILTAIISVAGVVYIMDLINTLKELEEPINNTNVMSFITVGLSMVLSIVGIVIAWIFRDKEYKKDRF